MTMKTMKWYALGGTVVLAGIITRIGAALYHLAVGAAQQIDERSGPLPADSYVAVYVAAISATAALGIAYLNGRRSKHIVDKNVQDHATVIDLSENLHRDVVTIHQAIERLRGEIESVNVCLLKHVEHASSSYLTAEQISQAIRLALIERRRSEDE